MASSDAFPDSSFSTSSSSGNKTASKGRLNGVGVWGPKNNTNADDYLQIDLKYEYVICAVATQGHSNAYGWTEEYKIQLSLDGTKFVTYQDNNVDKVGLS